MKLLVLQSELGVLLGGGENFTRNLFGTMAKRGHEISAAFVAGPSGSYPLPLPSGMIPIPLRGRWSRKPGQPALSFLARFVTSGSRPAAALGRIKDSLDWRGAHWHDRRFQRRVLQELAGRWNEFDAVYVHLSAELAAETARHVPTILRLPGPLPPESAALLHKVSVVCANGDALACLRTFMGEDVVELPVGLNSEMFSPGDSPIRTKLGWTKDHKVIGYVGRLTRLKGVDVLAEAFLQLTTTVPEARLIIIGHGEEEQRTRYILAKQIDSGIVHMVPGVNSADLPPWYRAMDVFALPSRYENFSNALLEATACGIPFIASNVGGNRTLKESGAGLLFEGGSAMDLTGRMREFCGNFETLRASALAFSSVVRERYNWNASADRLEWILDSKLKVKGHRSSVQRERTTTQPPVSARATL